jgi:hypothetical protein
MGAGGESVIPAFGFWPTLVARCATEDRCDAVLSFSTGRAGSPDVLHKQLILREKLCKLKGVCLGPVAQPSSTICVFFAQHLFEIAQTGL